jgi:ATP synthase protein I
MEQPPSRDKESLPGIVDRKTKRKIEARQKKQKSLFFGLGVFGVVGWSVAIPTLIGAMIGRWLDAHSNLPISWTLTCIFLGMVVGCVIAWNWMNKEGKPD